MTRLRRRLAQREVTAVAAAREDLTVDLLRFSASGITLAIALFLTQVG